MSKIPKITVYEDLEGEIWMPVVGSEEKYLVSNKCRLKRTMMINNTRHGKTKSYSERLLKGHINSDGYRIQNLRKDGYSLGISLHRLVAMAFISNPLNLPEVNHLDGIKENNYPENLQWCTHEENMKHASEMKLFNDRKGVCHHRTSFTENQILAIRRLHRIRPKISRSGIAKKYNISASTVSAIIQRTNWTHI